MRKKFFLGSILLASVIFSGCSSKTNGKPGKAIDDYLENAIVCIDYNENGKCDSGEVSAKTDKYGNFFLPSTSKPIVMDCSNAKSGECIDIVSKTQYKGILASPKGGAVVNSLSTLVYAAVKEGKTLDEAKKTVREKLGLPDGVDPVNFDPVVASNTPKGKKVLAAQTKVQLVLTVAASAGVDPLEVAQELSKKIEEGKDLDEAAKETFSNTNDLSDAADIIDDLINSVPEEADRASAGAVIKVVEEKKEEITSGDLNTSEFENLVEETKNELDVPPLPGTGGSN